MKTKTKSNNKVHRNVRIDPDQWVKFRYLVENNGSTVSKTLRKFIDNYIEGNS